jgi:prepilin-type N-terminal cleavage/methylation domain-containing protein
VKKNRGVTLVELLVIIVIIGILAWVVIPMSAGSSSDNSAIAAAEAQGFSNVRVATTHRWLSASWHGCGNDDWKATVVTATNPLGRTVTMTVCEGLWFKKATVRF